MAFRPQCPQSLDNAGGSRFQLRSYPLSGLLPVGALLGETVLEFLDSHEWLNRDTRFVPFVIVLLIFSATPMLLAPVSRWLLRSGQTRLAAYWGYTVFMGSVTVVVPALNWAEGELHLLTFLHNIRFHSEATNLHIIGATVLLVLSFSLIGASSLALTKRFNLDIPESAILFRPDNAVERFFWVHVMSPVSGFCEEMIFRGYLLYFLLQTSHDIVIAVSISSLIFGVLHYTYGLAWTIGSTFMGAIAALVVIAVGSIWPAVIAHALYNMSVYYVFDDKS